MLQQPSSFTSPKQIRVIGVDFDDVLHDFNNALHDYHNKKYGTRVQRKDIISYDIDKIWGCTPDEAIAKVHDFYHTPEHDETMPLQGSREIIKKLSKLYDLHIITSRVDEIRELTMSWLDRHFPKMFTSVQFINHYGTSAGKKKKKADVCTELSVDLMIEDSIEHARAISACGIPVILIDCPWNQGEISENICRVTSWQEIGRLLLDQKTMI